MKTHGDDNKAARFLAHVGKLLTDAEKREVVGITIAVVLKDGTVCSGTICPDDEEPDVIMRSVAKLIMVLQEMTGIPFEGFK